MKRPETLLRWGPAAVATLAIFALGSAPSVPGADLTSDKVLHVVAFGVLAVLWLRALQGRSAPVRLGPAAGAIGLSIACGALLEVLQGLLAWREASAMDVVADAVGAVLGCAALGAVVRIARGRRGSGPV